MSSFGKSVSFAAGTSLLRQVYRPLTPNLKGFLYIYFFLYCIWYAFDMPVRYLIGVYSPIHIAVFIYLARSFFQSLKDSKGSTFIWLLLFLFFLFPGAYLEFPADPWEHMRRILRWQAGGTISDYPDAIRNRFEYFFNYTFIWWLPYDHIRAGMSFLSSVWQFVVCVQIYRLSIALNIPRGLSIACSLVFPLLWGTNLFGIRYYALASTMLAYACYIECLIIILRAKRSNIQTTIIHILLLSLIIAFNHKQELIFLGISGLALIGISFFDRLSHSVRMVGLGMLAFILFLGFVFGLTAKYYGVLGDYIDYQSLAFWGGYNVLSKHFINTLGVHGIIGLLCAIFLIRDNPRLSLLSLAPSLFLIFPPTAMLLNYNLHTMYGTQYLSYRILYAFLPSLTIIPVLYRIVNRFCGRKEALNVILVVLLLALLSLPRSYPWRGRFWFQMYKPIALREMLPLEETVDWFVKNRDIDKLRRCWITTDDITRTVIYTYIGGEERVLGGDSARRGRLKEAIVNKTTEVLRNMVNLDVPFCGVLAGILDRIPTPPASVVGEESGHWQSCAADLHCSISREFEKAASGLTEHGWSKTFVPPWYYLYEPK